MADPATPPAPGAAQARSGGGLGFHAARWAPAIAVAALAYLVFPPTSGPTRVFAVGRVADRDIFAPTSFEVRKSESEIAIEADARAATVRPIYRFSTATGDSVVGSIRGFFAALEQLQAADSMADSIAIQTLAGTFGVEVKGEEAMYLADARLRPWLRDALTTFMAGVLSRGVADAGALQGELNERVVLLRDGIELTVSRDSIATFADLMAQAEEVHPLAGDTLGDRMLRKLTGSFFRPNVTPAEDLTRARREDMRRGVDSLKYLVSPGERIVAAGQLVTPEIHDKLLSLEQHLLQKGGAGVLVRTMVGQILYNSIVISVFWLLLMLYRRDAYNSFRQMVFFAALFAVVIEGAGIFLWIFPNRPELIPIPFAAILITMLYTGRIAVVAASTLAILLGAQWMLRDTNTLFFGLVGGVAAAVGMRVVRRRKHLYITFGVITCAYALAALTLALIYAWTPETIMWSVVAGAVSALGSASVALMFVPLAEAATRITTDLTLLELSDPSRPLLRRLAMEAPGTYAHSFAMANLCEAACSGIGANGLLARVGCYYHDIGKLKAPLFFIENQQRGVNPHDALEPQQSAQIIRDHVHDGLALAEEAGLPEVVKAFIPEHHGTSQIGYFLERARGRGLNIELDPQVFRYPGPLPRSAETAVAMLADSIEAALRVLDNPAPAQVRDVIEHLVNLKTSAGQFRDAPLTLRDLDRVKEELIRLMTGMYHNRIEYPSASGGISAEFARVRQA